VLEFLGLPWHGDILRFHEFAKDKAVATPSWEAVSRPTNTKAIGGWRKYARHFEPYQEQLGPFLKAFGYDE
jgi:hypothetical protein